MIKNVLKVSAMVLVFGMATGCASQADRDQVQASIDSAARDAAAAQSAAEAARAAADSAAQAARAAQSTAERERFDARIRELEEYLPKGKRARELAEPTNPQPDGSRTG
jgi:hypothetical protein